MSYQYKFEEPSNVNTFEDLKGALKERFDDLFSKGYLYKGDMGETPQIVNRPLAKFNDNGEFEDWTALGKSIIEAIFKDTKYYAARGMFINALTTDGKLNSLNDATYPWWCADGNPDYPIYPATYFVYIDSTPKDIRNNDESWEDNSCILIPADVEYSDYRDGATSEELSEELEPMITYHKNHIYPTFYFDPNAKGVAAGAWCWKINDVETGIPASVANADGSVPGRMFIFKKEYEKIEGTEETKAVYYYKAGVDAKDEWMTRQKMIDKELRYPINGDIGFTIEKKDETNINTLQIYNFVENNDEVNGGDWGRGENLISFGESFYKALWKFISSDSGIEINKGKIILGTTGGNHCIFVKKNGEDGNQTLILMPYQGDPSEKTDFVNDDIWKEAKLQINYPETKFVNDVSINGNLNTSIITSKSINNDGDISCKNIKTSGSISTEGSISCGEITANNFAVNRDEIIIGSNNTTGNKVNILSNNFSVTDSYIDTKLPLTSSNNINISNTSNEYIKIHPDKQINAVRKELSSMRVETGSKTDVIIPEGGVISARGYVSNSKVSECTVTVTYASKEYILPSMESITLSMPYSLGITINVRGENNYGSWPLLGSGSKMTLELIAKTADGDKEVLYTNNVTIAGNNGSGFNNDPSTKYCTIYCSIPSNELNSISSKLTNNKSYYNSIYITAEAIFKLETRRGTWGQKNTIYEAGTKRYICSCTLSPGGGSMWSSNNPAESVSGKYAIFKANIETQKPISSNNIKTVHICPDGILIGKAGNNSAVFYIDSSGGFYIDYYRPTAGLVENINILSIDTDRNFKSDVFQLKQTTTSSTPSSESKK